MRSTRSTPFTPRSLNPQSQLFPAIARTGIMETVEPRHAVCPLEDRGIGRFVFRIEGTLLQHPLQATLVRYRFKDRQIMLCNPGSDRESTPTPLRTARAARGFRFLLLATGKLFEQLPRNGFDLLRYLKQP